MNPFLRYLADKHSAHRHTDRHTPMTTRPCGLRRAGNKSVHVMAGKFSYLFSRRCNSCNYFRRLLKCFVFGEYPSNSNFSADFRPVIIFRRRQPNLATEGSTSSAPQLSRWGLLCGRGNSH